MVACQRVPQRRSLDLQGRVRIGPECGRARPGTGGIEQAEAANRSGVQRSGQAKKILEIEILDLVAGPPRHTEPSRSSTSLQRSRDEHRGMDLLVLAPGTARETVDRERGA